MIPRRLLEKVERYEHRDTPALQLTKKWIESDAWCLALFGEPDRGKSFAAAWAYRRSWDLPRGPCKGGSVWINAGTLAVMTLDRIRADLHKAMESPFVVVDDIGTESEHASAMINAMLCYRGDNEYRTVLTCNVTVDDFDERYKGRLTSRFELGGVSDNGRPKWTRVVGGESLRRVPMVKRKPE